MRAAVEGVEEDPHDTWADSDRRRPKNSEIRTTAALEEDEMPKTFPIVGTGTRGGEENADKKEEKNDLVASQTSSWGAICLEAMKKADNFGIFASRSPFFLLITRSEISPDEISQRAKSLWSAVAIISALVLTISCSNLTTAMNATDGLGTDSIYTAYVLLNWLCCVFNVLSCCIITVAWANLETVPIQHVRQFFTIFYWMAAAPGVLFSLGGACLIGAYVVQFYVTLPTEAFIATVVLGLLVFVLIMIYQTYTHGMCIEMH